MVCATLTITAPKPTISTMGAVSMGNQIVKISWYQNVSGTVRITDNGASVQQGNYPAGANYLELDNVTYGTHNFCVEAV